MSADYKRLTRPELRKMQEEGDAAAGAEIERRKDLVRRHRDRTRHAAEYDQVIRGVGATQAADAIRAREQATIESMMSLLVDLKTAVASLEAKIDKMIGGGDQEH